ncbi:hypothetical protein NDU88_006292 [Pleurodeles waltl]|uniref:Uncharacterized protein n=1 Tax=Pleurodeles waltl TaxID=8319 RepID=A0AAV7TXE3_PLEWA|nr:hypothetical protein NDU88_006292 [Pleurodeles waltl]
MAPLFLRHLSVTTATTTTSPPHWDTRRLATCLALSLKCHSTPVLATTCCPGSGPLVHTALCPASLQASLRARLGLPHNTTAQEVSGRLPGCPESPIPPTYSNLHCTAGAGRGWVARELEREPSSARVAVPASPHISMAPGLRGWKG